MQEVLLLLLLLTMRLMGVIGRGQGPLSWSTPQAGQEPGQVDRQDRQGREPLSGSLYLCQLLHSAPSSVLLSLLSLSVSFFLFCLSLRSPVLYLGEFKPTLALLQVGAAAARAKSDSLAGCLDAD